MIDIKTVEYSSKIVHILWIIILMPTAHFHSRDKNRFIEQWNERWMFSLAVLLAIKQYLAPLSLIIVINYSCTWHIPHSWNANYHVSHLFYRTDSTLCHFVITLTFAIIKRLLTKNNGSIVKLIRRVCWPSYKINDSFYIR